MDYKSTGLIETTAPGVRAEIGTIIHEGKEFSSGGAFLSESHAVGYLHREPDGSLSIRTWNGERMGTARALSSWETPRSYVSRYYFQVEADIDGRTYTGRTAGTGMLWKGKRKRGKSRKVDSQSSYFNGITINARLGKG